MNIQGRLPGGNNSQYKGWEEGELHLLGTGRGREGEQGRGGELTQSEMCRS